MSRKALVNGRILQTRSELDKIGYSAAMPAAQNEKLMLLGIYPNSLSHPLTP